jgi:hypothetical protein
MLRAMWRGTLLVVWIGCAHGAAALHNDGVAAPKPTPCPPDAELAAFARTIWNAGTYEVRSLACIEVRRAGASMWWIEGQVAFPPDGDEYGDSPWLRSLVAANDRRVTWTERGKPLPVGIQHYDRGTADFDGDGNDEIWMVETVGEGGASATSFVVIDIVKEPVVMQVRLGWMNDAGEHECSGTQTLLKRGARMLIDVTRSGACSAEDKPHELFERRGNELVPVVR